MLQLVADAPVLAKEQKLSSDMPVSRAIDFVQSLDKKKTCAIIDKVPDQVVAYHVLQYMSEKTGSAGTENLVSRVKAVWLDIQRRLDKTAQNPPVAVDRSNK